MDKPTFLDILLFPKAFYRRITDKLPTLFLGIIFVGISNAAFMLYEHIPGLLFNKPQTVIIFNSSLALCIAVLLGLVDVIFFSLPLFDIFKFFRVKERIKNINGQLIKLMKVYISAHLVIVPVNALFLATLFLAGAGGMSADFSASVILLQFILIPIWLSAIVTRGINTIYNFDDRLKSMVFVIVYTWQLLLAFALEYLTGSWMMQLFKQ